MPHIKSKGDVFRKAFEDARNYEHRSQVQLEELDKYFKSCFDIFNKLIQKLEDDMNLADLSMPDDRSKWLIIENLEKKVSVKYPVFLEIDTTLTDYTAEQVCALPHYIRLHEVARRENIALKLIGIVKESLEEGEDSGEKLLVIDTGQEYEDGRDDLYPNLPPRPLSLDRQPGSHKLKS